MDDTLSRIVDSGSTTELPAAETYKVNPRIKDLRPVDFVSYGFVLYSESVQGPRSERENRGPLVELAGRVRSRVEQLIGKFAPESPEGVYISKGLMAALSFASGLHSTKRHLDDRRQKAQERRVLETQRQVLVSTKWGLLRGAVQLFVIGGFFFAVSKILTTLFPPREGLSDLWLSLATSFGAVLAGIAWLSSTMGKSLQDIDREYRIAVDNAELKQAEGHLFHLELALTVAKRAWQTLTNEELTEDDSVELALRELIHLNMHEHRRVVEEEHGILWALRKLIGTLSRSWKHRNGENLPAETSDERGAKVPTSVA